jgi:hypothetical protein
MVNAAFLITIVFSAEKLRIFLSEKKLNTPTVD